MATKSVNNTTAVPSERLQKLLLDTNRPDPYPVTNTLVIDPPTKKRREELRLAHQELGRAQELMARALMTAPAARPDFPMPPEPLSDKATAKQQAAHKLAVTQYEKLAAGWRELNEQWEAAVLRHSEKVDELGSRINEQADRYTRALFGPVYDDVIAFFDDQDQELWEAFQVDIQEQFRIITRPPEVPDDGTCPTCGHVDDEEQAGKAPESST